MLTQSTLIVKSRERKYYRSTWQVGDLQYIVELDESSNLILSIIRKTYGSLFFKQDGILINNNRYRVNNMLKVLIVVLYVIGELLYYKWHPYRGR